MPEPIGVIGVVCPDAPPLLGFVSTVLAAIAMGNTVIVVPSARCAARSRSTSTRCSTPRTCRAAWSTSSPGSREELAPVLAAHDDVDGIWYFGSGGGCAEVERLSAGNMKRTWVSHGHEP